jgi:two-component system, NtrC family, response regulator HydG
VDIQVPVPTKGPTESVVPASCPAENDQKTQLVEALRRAGGNKSEAARILGINRVTVFNRMRKYGIDMKTVIQV